MAWSGVIKDVKLLAAKPPIISCRVRSDADRVAVLKYFSADPENLPETEQDAIFNVILPALSKTGS